MPWHRSRGARDCHRAPTLRLGLAPFANTAGFHLTNPDPRFVSLARITGGKETVKNRHQRVPAALHRGIAFTVAGGSGAFSSLVRACTDFAGNMRPAGKPGQHTWSTGAINPVCCWLAVATKDEARVPRRHAPKDGVIARLSACTERRHCGQIFEFN